MAALQQELAKWKAKAEEAACAVFVVLTYHDTANMHKLQKCTCHVALIHGFSARGFIVTWTPVVDAIP